MKILVLIAYLFLISLYSYCQNEQGNKKIIKHGKLYDFNDGFYDRRELKEVIYSSRDATAIKFIDQANGYNVAGNVLIIGGGITMFTGFVQFIVIQSLDHFSISGDMESSKSGLIIAGVGAGMIVIGGILKGVGNSALEKSIKRFNSIQVASQNLQFNIVPAPDYIRIGLTWNLDY